MSYNLSLQTNNAEIQELISIVNALPDAGGVELPDLTNPGNARTLLDGYELIDQEGKVVAGTIPTNDAADLTVDGATITVPAGYYASQATKSVETTTHAIPAISVDSNGKITASVFQNKGYISGGITSATEQLPTQSGKTIAPSTSSQTVIESGVYTTGAITVSAMPVAEQATPTITVSSSGLITATAIQNSGYVEAGTKTKTQQLTTQATKTITPTKSEQTAVSSGVYTTGAIKVAPIPDKYIDSSDATSDVNEVFLGETFYANGEKKVGTFTIESELSEQDELLAELEEILNTKSAAGGEANPVLQSKTVSPTTSSQTVTADSGYDGLRQVTVNAIPSEYIVPTGTLPITENGTYDVKNYVSATVNIAGSGGGEDNATLNGLLDGTLSTYTDGTMSIIRTGLFMGCGDLSTINIPECNKIGSYAFYQCSKLTNIAFPKCSRIYDYGFYQCSRITSVSFPTCTVVEDGAFAQCSSLTEASFPACTTVLISAFASCKSMTTVNMPACTSVYNYAFNTCEILTDVNLPSCKVLLNSAFSNCYALSTLSFPALQDIRPGAFMKCYNLKSLYLMGSTLCKLSNSNAFSSTPIGGYSTSAGTYGSIYVPASMLASYKSATNWTYFSNRMVGI